MNFDITLLTYLTTEAALLYNFILFSVWLFFVRREAGKISEIYIVIMCLFVSRFYGVALGITARFLRGHGDYITTHDNSGLQNYYEFMDGFAWDTRLTPEAFIFIVLGVVLTRRFVKSYLYRDPEYRRTNGNRKTDN